MPHVVIITPGAIAIQFTKPCECEFGNNCYRTNPRHLEMFHDGKSPGKDKYDNGKGKGKGKGNGKSNGKGKGN